MKTVAVIVPTYNVAKYIVQTLDSIAAQTYPSDKLRLYVRDDASTDATWETIQSWILTTKHPFLSGSFVRSQENQGWARNTNLTVDDALGDKPDYIFLMGSDDWLAPNAIEVLVQTLEEEPAADFVCPDGVIWEDGKFVGRHSPRSEVRVEDFKSQNWFTGFPLIRVSMWEDLGGFETEIDKRGAFEDWEFWIRALKAGYKHRTLHGDYYYYRSHTTQTSRRVDAENYVKTMLGKHFPE